MDARTAVHVAMACHDRRATTLACLDHLAAQDLDGVDVRVHLVDDGSTDGTADAVAAAHPDVHVIPGDGSLFWNGGMRVAVAAALEHDPDHVLLLNDDTHLDPGALHALLATAAELRERGHPPAVVVGSVRSPDGTEVTYGGRRRGTRAQPLRYPLVEPGDRPLQAATFDGNCVLLPRQVLRRVGNLDPVFTHAMGDYDYGLRALRAGCEVWVAPGTVGTCEANPGFVPDPHAPLRDELARLRSIKHLPPAQWRAYTSRWAGPLWPVFFASPYLRRALALVRARRRRPA
jgi:GT2 family glycosyltransferase